MSDGNEGVLVSDDSGVYFIPGDQLGQYKLSDDAAKSVADAVGGDDVAGFAKSVEHYGNVRPLNFAFGGEFKPAILKPQYSDNPI